METFTLSTQLNVTQYNVTESMTNEVELTRFQCFTLVFVLGGLAAVIAKSLGAPVERIKLIQQILYRQDTEDKTKSDGVQSKTDEEQVVSYEDQTKSDKVQNMTDNEQTFSHKEQTKSDGVQKKIEEEQPLPYEEQTKSDEEQTKSPRLRFGLLSCAKYIYQTEGLLSFWRGNLTNCLRYVPKMAFDMAFKEELKIFFKEIIKPGDNFGLAFLAKWLSGTVAACCSTVICYPLDFIRTSLAVDMGR